MFPWERSLRWSLITEIKEQTFDSYISKQQDMDDHGSQRAPER